MRKKISLILVLAVLMSMVAVPAFAAPANPKTDYDPQPTASQTVKGFYGIGTASGVTITPKTSGDASIDSISIDADDDGDFDELYPDSVKLGVTYSNATGGKNYIIFLSTNSGVPSSSEEVYYVKQGTASGSGTVSVEFNVYPKDMATDLTLYLLITSDDGNGNIQVPLFYCAESEHWLEPTGGAVLKGDVNLDLAVDGKDITLLRRYNKDKVKYPLSDAGLANADVNGDHAVDGKDITLLRRYNKDKVKYPLP